MGARTWFLLQAVIYLFVASIFASTVVRLPSAIPWNCGIYDKAWGEKTYTLKQGDFCSKKGTLRDTSPVYPSCNKQVFPTITFYYPEDSRTNNCNVTMEFGAKDERNIDCISKVVESITKHRIDKLAYTTHGVFGIDFIKRYNGSSIGWFGRLFDKAIKKWHARYDRWLYKLSRTNTLTRSLISR